MNSNSAGNQKPEIFDYTFNGQAIHFQLFGKNIMVNATEMAKIFDKQVVAFLRNDNTKSFIEECLKSENSHFLDVENEEDLVTSKQKSGTWMHRVLALKFAAWLDPKFELWVFCTIDHILFGHLKKIETELKESAERRNKLKTLQERLMSNPDYLELAQLQLAERQSAYRRSKIMTGQRDLFEEMLFNN